MVSMVAFLDGTVVNLALPAIERDLGGGLPLQQWVVDSYLLAMGALILPGGSISDLFGRVRVMRVGLAAFGVGSVLAATAMKNKSPVMENANSQCGNRHRKRQIHSAESATTCLGAESTTTLEISGRRRRAEICELHGLAPPGCTTGALYSNLRLDPGGSGTCPALILIS